MRDVTAMVDTGSNASLFAYLEGQEVAGLIKGFITDGSCEDLRVADADHAGAVRQSS